MRAMGLGGRVIAAMGRSYDMDRDAQERAMRAMGLGGRVIAGKARSYSNCSRAYAASSASIASSGLHLAAFS